MADIIRFDRARLNASSTSHLTPTQSAAELSMSEARSRPSEPFRETPRQRAGRRRNPLRMHAERVSLAVTIAGHLANGRTDRLHGWGDYVAMPQRGAARFLAEELDDVVAREEALPPIA